MDINQNNNISIGDAGRNTISIRQKNLAGPIRRKASPPGDSWPHQSIPAIEALVHLGRFLDALVTLVTAAGEIFHLRQPQPANLTFTLLKECRWLESASF